MSEDLKNGLGIFITLKIRQQLISFLEEGRLIELMENFAKIDRSRVRGKSHDELIKNFQIDLTVGCDAGPITNTSRVSAFPIVLFINNIPVCHQSRFPILAALHTGNSASKPPLSLFFNDLKSELRELCENPLEWKRSPTMLVKTHVFITINQADAPQLADLMNMKHHSGTYSCPFCFIEGYHNGKAVKFPGIILETNQQQPRRTEEIQLMLAEEVCDKIRQNPTRACDVQGVKGFPILYALPYYDAIYSNAPDSLHVIFKGIMKPIMVDLCDKSGGDRNLSSDAHGGYAG